MLLLNHSFDSSNPADSHPFIVLSVNEANEQEKTFVAVMVTSSEKTRDDFSFELSNDMFSSPLGKDNSHVRMHLITSLINNCIIRKVNTMKTYAFNQLMRSIGDLIFNFDFIPL